MTNEELAYFTKQHTERQADLVDLDNLRTGVLASAIYNASGRQVKQLIKPSDFFNFRKRKADKPKATPAEIAKSQASVIEGLLVNAKTRKKQRMAEEAKKGNVSK